MLSNKATKKSSHCLHDYSHYFCNMSNVTWVTGLFLVLACQMLYGSLFNCVFNSYLIVK